MAGESKIVEERASGDVATGGEGKEAPKIEVEAPKKLEGAELKSAIQAKLQYYMSRENLESDAFLISKMTNDMWVEVGVISKFRGLAAIGATEEDITAAAKELEEVSLSADGKSLKPNIKVERKTLIIRDISEPTQEELDGMFSHLTGDNAPVEVKPSVGNTLFVTFKSEDACLKAHASLSDITFRGAPIKGRVKSETLVKSLYQAPVIVEQAQYPQGMYMNQYMYPQRYGGRGQGQMGGGRGGRRGGREGNDRRPRGPKGGKRNGNPQLQLGPQNFPPLPSADKTTGTERRGYTGEFKKFDLSELLSILERTSDDIRKKRPEFITAHEGVIIDKPAVDINSDIMTWEDSSHMFAQLDQTPLDRTSHSPFVSPMFVAVADSEMPTELMLPSPATSYATVTQHNTPLKSRSLVVPTTPSTEPAKEMEGNSIILTPPTPTPAPAAASSTGSEGEEKASPMTPSSFKDILLAKKNNALKAEAEEKAAAAAAAKE